MAWQEITDFTPGIRDTPSPAYPPGTLQSSGTFRCRASESGALTPLPRRTNNYFFLPDKFPDPTTLLSPVFLCGLHCRNPVFWPGQTAPGVDQNNTDILLGLEYYATRNGSSHLHYELWRLYRHFGIPGYERMWQHTEPATYDPVVRPKRMSFTSGRSNTADPTAAGPIVTGFCIDGHALMFPPDDTTAGQNLTRYLPGDKSLDPNNNAGLVSPDFILGHQGRAVLWPLTLNSAGDQTIHTNNEAFYWTEPNDWRVKPDDVGFFQMIVGWEDPTGYQVRHSLSASELVMLKSRGGGIVIRGDLGGGTTTGSGLQADRQRYVRSPGFSMNNGTVSPIGLIYPVDQSGVWVWGGGETSSHLTPTMPGDFWRPPPDPFFGHGFTSCDTWGDWVVLPDAWLLDTEPQTPSLWRLDDPDMIDLHHHSVDWRGRFLYAQSDRMTDIGVPGVVEYDTAYPASSWQARLHPIAASIERQQEVRQVGVVASGAGRVTVTIRTAQSTAGEQVVFEGGGSDAAGRFLWRQTRGCQIRGSHVEFTINAAAANDADPAPTVHALLWDPESTTPEPTF